MNRDWHKDMDLAVRSYPPSRRLIPRYNEVDPGEYLEEILFYWLQQYAAEKERADKAEERELKLKDLLLEIERDCRPSGWYNGPIYGQIEDLLASLYPKE